MGNRPSSEMRFCNYLVWYPRYAGGEPTGKPEQHQAYVCYALARSTAIAMGAKLSRVVNGEFGEVVLDGAAILKDRAAKGLITKEGDGHGIR